MTRTKAEKIRKGIDNKIRKATVDMEWWADFWGFTVDEYEEFLDMAIKALEQESSSATGKWIPVSERLPEKETEVLITADELFRQLYVASYTYNGWDFVEGVFDDEKVLAWMPLPEPYKERKE